MSISIRIQRDINGGYAGIYRNKMGRLNVVFGNTYIDVISKVIALLYV